MAGLSTQFIAGLLAALGAPATSANVAFMTAWAHREGGNAQYNPWNTTYSLPGATTYNSVGVRNYTSLQQGIQATAATLDNGLYQDVLSALRHGDASTSTRYTGLHNWSAGPRGSSSAGYWSLGGVSTAPPDSSGTGTGTVASGLQAPSPPPPPPNNPALDPLAAANEAGALGTDTIPHDTPGDAIPATDPTQAAIQPDYLNSLQAANAPKVPTPVAQGTVGQGVPFTSTTAQKGAGARIIAAAEQLMGTPYKWGGDGPGGVDCSGLVQWAYKQAGIQVPRISYLQANAGHRVSVSKLRPGDLVAWDDSPRNPGADHIAIYLGNGMIIEAAHPGTRVDIRKLGSWSLDSNAYGVTGIW